MSAGAFIINSLNDAGAAELYKNLDHRQLLELLLKSNPARLFEIFQTGVQMHANYQALKSSQTTRETIDALMKTLPEDGKAFKAVPQIQKSLQDLENISKAVQQRQIRIADTAFNSEPVYTALFRSVALGKVSLPLHGMDAAVSRLSNGLSGMRDELSIENMSRLQGWGDTDGTGYGAYIHKFVLGEMRSYPGPGRASPLVRLRRLGRKLGNIARASKAEQPVKKVEVLAKTEKAKEVPIKGKGKTATVPTKATAAKATTVNTGKALAAKKGIKTGKGARGGTKTGKVEKVENTSKALVPAKPRNDVTALAKSAAPAARGHPYHYFYVWHPGTDWYPDFERMLKKHPLPPNFGGYCADLVTLCLWMSLNREVLRRTSVHGETAVFHLLIPTFYPIVPEVPIVFHTNLFPLVVTSQTLRQEDLVGLDIRGDNQGLTLQGIKKLKGEVDAKASFPDLLSGQMVSSVACSIASTVFPPAAPMLTPAVVGMITSGVSAVVDALKTLVYQSITSEGTVVLGQPSLVDPRL